MARLALLATAAMLVALVISACGGGDINRDLLKAVEQGKLAQVKSLLAKGANVDAKDDFDRTALMLSALGGHDEIAALLIQAGADVRAKAKYGQTALQFAVERGNEAIAALLRTAGADS